MTSCMNNVATSGNLELPSISISHLFMQPIRVLKMCKPTNKKGIRYIGNRHLCFPVRKCYNIRLDLMQYFPE